MRKVNPAREEDGSLLIVSVWISLLLGLLALSLSFRARLETRIAEIRQAMGPVPYSLVSLVNRARVLIDSDESPEIDHRSKSWYGKIDEETISDEAFGPADDKEKKDSVSMEIVDEESKININKAPLSVLKDLFKTAAGLDEEEANSIAASVVNWRSPADHAEKAGAGTFHYQTLERPYKCKNASLEALE